MRIGWLALVALVGCGDRTSARMFYIAAGHNAASYTDPNFVEILGRGIEWSARQR